MSNWYYRAAFTGLSAIILAACGGGGSSGSPTPSPQGGGTPPPTNSAPVASVKASDTAPNEGLKSSLDASDSSDADGDTLTYSWTQLSGPDLVFSSTSGVTTEVTVPNLTADQSARIQLQVSDGALTTTEEITLTLTNVVLAPVANSTISNEETLSYTNRALALPTVSAFFETINYLVHESEGRYIWDTLFYDVDDSKLTIDTSEVESEPGKIIPASVTNFNRSFAVMTESKANFLTTDRTPSELFSIDIDRPCDLVNGFNHPREDIIIGQLDGGAKLIRLEQNEDFEPTGVSTIVQSFGGNASFCDMQIVQSPLNGEFRGGGSRLLAFDQNTNQISEYSIITDSTSRITGVVENAVVPVALDLPEGTSVEFVSSSKIDSSGNKGIALIFSNGETEGVHRLVIVGINANGAVSQETYSWSYGVPKGISHAYFDDHEGDSLVITSKDSPHAVIFKSGGFFAGDTPYLPLSGPSFFDLGIGHDLVTRINGGSPRRLGTLVTYPDQNLVKVFERD